MNRDKSLTGFTLIELMLSMAFVAILLIAIAMTSIQITNTYNRGMVYKGVNQVGRQIASEFQRNISTGSAFDVSSSGKHYLNQTEVGGRLCTGQYTYVWNYGKALQAALKSGDTSKLYNRSVNANTIISFAKILDQDSAYCTDSTKKIAADAVELLNNGSFDLAAHTIDSELNLAIQQFSIVQASASPDPKTGQQLYTISFQVGTNNNDTLNFDSSGATCLVTGAYSDLNYCSVSQFDIVVRAGNAVE
ncbi:hypothetical protein HGB24_00820 [Candidatus Saccharibacteria bacterium]|nr:hypothetical protein [Candidatus Saccharibacteria bacterium]